MGSSPRIVGDFMPTAKNMQELEEMLKKEMKTAMEKVSKQALADMQYETNDFYKGTTPTMYKRTDNLKNSPRVTDVKENGNAVSFTAHLATGGDYTSGKNPSVIDVFNMAEDHNNNPADLRYALGKQGFWKRSEQKIEKDLEQEMKNIFN